ncbi:MAG TPA: amidase [Anaerolineae bacterium]|nr:amidase [Anaerolineae bacterium]
MSTSHAEPIYDLQSVKLPYLSGTSLKLFAAALEGPARGLLLPNLLKQAGVTWLRAQVFDEWPTFEPIAPAGPPAAGEHTLPPEQWPDQPPFTPAGWRFATTFDYARAYAQGQTDPVQVAEALLAAIEAFDAQDPPLRAFIEIDREDVLRQAQDSARRWAEGRPISVLDGAPVAVKDELDMTPYPTRMGTTFLGQEPVKEDAIAVARMRRAGALLVGKTNMHEIGIGVTGFNSHYGAPRNPYNPAHYTGGSSSGSAAVVAAGLVPIALGADGGGSIRIPAAFCGVYGLKPTYGRIPESSAFALDFSVAHVGPLAATVSDLALAYAVMAGPHPHDRISLLQASPTLAGWENVDLKGLTLGVFWPWFRHATPEMVAANEAMLERFRQMGARVKEIVIPDLEAARVAHVITITSEMNQALEPYYDAHHKELGLDVRISLALSRAFNARDFIQAQRVRTRLIAHFQAAFEEVDAIITPATGVTAPLIPESALPDGDSDLTTLTEIMRYAPFANLSGHPAISFPVGYSDAGLPIGMQAIGRYWDEVTLFRLALAAESALERRQPQLLRKIIEG